LLFAALIPLGLVFGMPGVPGATDFTVFFTAVPVACFLGGSLLSGWMLKTVVSHALLHGALIGVVATLLYLALCALQLGGIPAVIAGYGVPRLPLARLCGSAAVSWVRA
jgi:hypothetical protein